MKKFSQLIAVIGLSILLFSACNKEQSLQEYIVENQENSNFLSIDIPANVLQLNEDASKINDVNKDDYTTELQKVKAILKNDKFTELVRMKHDNASIQVKYLGSEDAIDEIILFASEQTKGFAVARVLGKNMQPEKMMKLVQNMDEMKKDSPVFAQIEGLLGEMK
jgi:hypothetical protein